MVSKEIIKEWTDLANEDFELAKHLIEEKWFYRAALSHLQQAVEKFTKAFLISKGWALRKIHDLETLFDEASKHEPGFRDYLEFGRKLTAYYTESRYPPLEEDVPEEEDVGKFRTNKRLHWDGKKTSRGLIRFASSVLNQDTRPRTQDGQLVRNPPNWSASCRSPLWALPSGQG